MPSSLKPMTMASAHHGQVRVRSGVELLTRQSIGGSVDRSGSERRLPGSAEPQHESVPGRLGYERHGLRFLPQDRGATHLREARGTRELRLGPLVQLAHPAIGLADDEQRRAAHETDELAREVGTAGQGEHGSHSARPGGCGDEHAGGTGYRRRTGRRAARRFAGGPRARRPARRPGRPACWRRSRRRCPRRAPVPRRRIARTSSEIHCPFAPVHRVPPGERRVGGAAVERGELRPRRPWPRPQRCATSTCWARRPRTGRPRRPERARRRPPSDRPRRITPAPNPVPSRERQRRRRPWAPAFPVGGWDRDSPPRAGPHLNPSAWSGAAELDSEGWCAATPPGARSGR